MHGRCPLSRSCILADYKTLSFASHSPKSFCLGFLARHLAGMVAYESQKEMHGGSYFRSQKSRPERRRDKLRKTLSVVEAHGCLLTTFLCFLLLTLTQTTAQSQEEIRVSFAGPRRSARESTKRHLDKLPSDESSLPFLPVYATAHFRSLA